jgi:hypothetical protein
MLATKTNVITNGQLGSHSGLDDSTMGLHRTTGSVPMEVLAAGLPVMPPPLLRVATIHRHSDCVCYDGRWEAAYIYDVAMLQPMAARLSQLFIWRSTKKPANRLQTDCNPIANQLQISLHPANIKNILSRRFRCV